MTWARLGFFRAVLPGFSLQLGQGNDATMGRFPAGAINFQIAHHDVCPVFDAKVDERIRDEHAHGVEHVGAALAVRNYQ